jgi:hypothetical protein
VNGGEDGEWEGRGEEEEGNVVKGGVRRRELGLGVPPLVGLFSPGTYFDTAELAVQVEGGRKSRFLLQRGLYYLFYLSSKITGI